jgi:hypothetical protein
MVSLADDGTDGLRELHGDLEAEEAARSRRSTHDGAVAPELVAPELLSRARGEEARVFIAGGDEGLFDLDVRLAIGLADDAGLGIERDRDGGIGESASRDVKREMPGRREPGRLVGEGGQVGAPVRKGPEPDVRPGRPRDDEGPKQGDGQGGQEARSDHSVRPKWTGRGT